ncbi:MAG: hypothetical protein NVS4B13_08970 [Candidatus Elarobacter sp.]
MQTTDVRETAQKAVKQGKSLLGKQVDARSTQIGQQIGSVAQDLRTVGDQLRQSDTGGMAAGYVDQGAQMVERLGRYLEEADSDRLIGDLEDYARQQPWAIAAAALVVGFAASRFLKTSSARRYRFDDGGALGGSRGDSSTGTSVYGSGASYGESTYGDTTYGVARGLRGGDSRYAT